MVWAMWTVCTFWLMKTVCQVRYGHWMFSKKKDGVSVSSRAGFMEGSFNGCTFSDSGFCVFGLGPRGLWTHADSEEPCRLDRHSRDERSRALVRLPHRTSYDYCKLTPVKPVKLRMKNLHPVCTTSQQATLLHALGEAVEKHLLPLAQNSEVTHGITVSTDKILIPVLWRNGGEVVPTRCRGSMTLTLCTCMCI